MEGGVLESPDTTLDRSDDEVALQGFCSPKRPPYRFLGLALMCLLGFGTTATVTLSLKRDRMATVYAIRFVFVSLHRNLIKRAASDLSRAY